MKVNIKALSFTFAIVLGGHILVIGLANVIWPTYGRAFLEVAASIYPGYQATASIGEVISGTLYGLVDGFVGGLIIGWLYNLLAAKESTGTAELGDA